IANGARYADPAGFGQSFQSGGDIHPITEYVVVLDYNIADIDPNSEFDAPVRRIGLLLGHTRLPFDRTTQRVNDTREFDEQAIARCLDDASTVLADLWVDSGQVLYPLSQNSARAQPDHWQS